MLEALIIFITVGIPLLVGGTAIVVNLIVINT
jgi:hypothetical protein